MNVIVGPRWALVLTLAVGVGLIGSVAYAAVVPISSVSAGTNGSPPYNLQSVTVGAFTATQADLATGTITAVSVDGVANPDEKGNFFGTWDGTPPAPPSTFDLNDVLGRHGNSNPVIVKSFGGAPLWTDVNGADPDFFIFEAATGGGDGDVTVQAILSDGSLGTAVNFPNTNVANWGDTGLDIVGPINGGQSITGISFAVTDLRDGAGAALPANAVLMGLQINSNGIDPTLIAAVVPEPASLALLLAVIGCSVLRVR